MNVSPHTKERQLIQSIGNMSNPSPSKLINKPRVIIRFCIKIHSQKYDKNNQLLPPIDIAPTDEHIEQLLNPKFLGSAANQPLTNLVVEDVKQLPDKILEITASVRSGTNRDFVVNTILKLHKHFGVDEETFATLISADQ